MSYVGSLTSLYTTIPDSVVGVLERAILQTRLGLYAHAERIFKEELRDHHTLPVIAIHHAELYLQQFRFRKSYETLKLASDAFPVQEAAKSQDDKPVDLNVQAYDLMELFKALCNIKCRALWEPAYDEIKRTLERLGPIAVETYSDIQVFLFFFFFFNLKHLLGLVAVIICFVV